MVEWHVRAEGFKKGFLKAKTEADEMSKKSNTSAIVTKKTDQLVQCVSKMCDEVMTTYAEETAYKTGKKVAEEGFGQAGEADVKACVDHPSNVQSGVCCAAFFIEDGAKVLTNRSEQVFLGLFF